VGSVFEHYEAFTHGLAKDISTFDASWQFFEYQFRKRFKGSSPLFVHLTSVVDPENVKKVWKAIVASQTAKAVEVF